MTGEHARIKPSSAYQWAECSASIPMQEAYPEDGSNPAAEEGNAVHWCAATVLADYLECGRKGHHFNRASFLDKPAPNGVLITDEMLDAVEMYVADVMRVSTRYDAFHGISWVLLEHRVYMPNIHPENWGTLDNSVIFFHPSCDTLVVSDLKYGWEIVDVFGNWQLIDYTAGLINELHGRGLPIPVNIEFRLVQPRPHHRDGHIRTWTVSLQELRPYFAHLQRQAHEALSINAQAVPGLHCTYCTGRHACQALRESVYSAVTVVTGATPSELDLVALGAHLKLLQRVMGLIEAQYTGYSTQALSAIQRGQVVPGWWVERAEGRLKWTKPSKEVEILGTLMKKNLRKDVLITPVQAIAAGMPEDVVKKFAERFPGEPKLVPADLKKSAAIFKAQ